MMQVMTYINRSRLHGIGLFATVPIRKGAIVWRFCPICDRRIPCAVVHALPEPARSAIKHNDYGADGYFVVYGDDTRFVNHSQTPNLECVGSDEMVALRDIEAGEELTENYRIFDQNFGSEEEKRALCHK